MYVVPHFLIYPDTDGRVSLGSSLQQKPSEAVANVVAAEITKLLPDEVSLEAFNSQYLQQHSSRADAVLASARVSRMLDAPREEVEASLFNALNAGVELKLEVCRKAVPEVGYSLLTTWFADRAGDHCVPVRDQLTTRGRISDRLQREV